MNTSRYLTSADGMAGGSPYKGLEAWEWHQSVYKQVKAMADGDVGSIKSILEAAVNMVTHERTDLEKGETGKFARDLIRSIGDFSVVEPSVLTARVAYVGLTGVDNVTKEIVGKLYKAYKKKYPEAVEKKPPPYNPVYSPNSKYRK